MTVLITGGAGYIGSHTALELLGNKKADVVLTDIVVLDNLCNSKPDVIDRLRKLSGRNVPFYNADCRDEKALDEIFTNHKIDAVIHFAGRKAVAESVAKPVEYYHNNIVSTLVLCRAMQKYGVNHIIFSSSATVYSGENIMPLTENSITGGCINPYGWSKYMCEQILTDAAKANQDWCVVNLRYFNPIGAHSSGMLGEEPSGVPANLLPYITQTAVGRREKLSVQGTDYPTPDGTCIRDYIHVVDLAKGHIAALDYCMNNKGAEVFNLGTGKGTSVLEMVEAFERSTGVKVPRINAPRRPGDQPVSYAATDKAEKVLNWRAEKSVEEGCADSWRWEQGLAKN